ncbi:GGDEF domain-containing protein [Rhizobium wenxiniae]|uniref:GGDEF domain-containing protein n=1 Tax=Rhizobium wenxiniae TaxID=1737357 RepID=UPI001C6E7B92|nr:GGDEF domain-containing protein [Rhizobium wenxiniae]MBW9089593.1 GGDEF domain-containing protein [Rhizobium wenxiniae]
MAIDFTEDRLRIEMLEETARTDALTGLLNRRGLSINYAALQSADGFAVLALDLDGFKEVNDTSGHAMGDLVLQSTAERLTSAVRSQDLVARTGGDEFVVIVAGDRSTGEAAAERIVARMREPLLIDDKIADVRTSIGGVWTGEKREVSELLKAADALLYDAKAAGKDTIMFQSAS